MEDNRRFRSIGNMRLTKETFDVVDEIARSHVGCVNPWYLIKDADEIMEYMRSNGISVEKALVTLDFVKYLIEASEKEASTKSEVPVFDSFDALERYYLMVKSKSVPSEMPV